MDEFREGYKAGQKDGEAPYRAIALRHRDTIKRLKAEMEAMRQQHHKDLARAARVARARMGMKMAWQEHVRWRDASIGVASYIDYTISTAGTGDEADT